MIAISLHVTLLSPRRPFGGSAGVVLIQMCLPKSQQGFPASGRLPVPAASLHSRQPTNDTREVGKREPLMVTVRVLQVWARYVQYPHYPKLCDQGLRETPGRVNPAEYVKYRMIRPAAGRVWGTNPTPWEPPDLRKVGGSPILGVVEAGQFTGLCHMGGRYSGLWVVSFVSPHLWVRGRCHRIIRCVMCRLWRGRWRRSSPAVIWLRRLVVLTARPSALSSRRWAPTVLLLTSTPTG